MISLDWTDFGTRLQERDRILFYETPGLRPNEVEIILRTTPDVRHWKQLAVLGGDYRFIGDIETEAGDNKPKALRLSGHLLDEATLMFSKITDSGHRAGVYKIEDLRSKKGKTLVFEWQQDS